MTTPLDRTKGADLDAAVAQLREAASAMKCWQCGCLHNALRSLEEAFPEKRRPPALDAAIQDTKNALVRTKYDCLGCDVCYPAAALSSLNAETDTCPAEAVEARAGWPPLPGSYAALRFHAPVAVCTLTGENLARAVALAAGPEVAIVGSVHTENLGLERIVRNTLANPNIRFLIVCGPDSHQAIGHLPGQSLVALARSGIDERKRIIGARGKRPVLKNLGREPVAYFRSTVEVLDLVGHDDVPGIVRVAAECGARDPGAAQPFTNHSPVSPVKGYVPERMSPDPMGYFVIYPDPVRKLILLEHFTNDGVLRQVIEGRVAAELYMPAIDRGLVSRLDHAAYLGKELARAERALIDKAPFVQNAAPVPKPELVACNENGQATIRLTHSGRDSSCGDSTE